MKINWFKIINNEYALFIMIKRILYSDNELNISDFLKLLKLGLICKDCSQSYYFCNCDKINILNINKKFILIWIINNLSKLKIESFIIYSMRDIKVYTLDFQKEMNIYVKQLRKYIYEN